MRNLVEDRSIIIKPADKGSRVVVWDREDYLAEGYKQLSDSSTYVEVKNYREKLLVDLIEKSNKIFKKLCNKKVITEKELKYFTYSFKNASCLGKMFLLPKINKRLSNFEDAHSTNPFEGTVNKSFNEVTRPYTRECIASGLKINLYRPIK